MNKNSKVIILIAAITVLLILIGVRARGDKKSFARQITISNYGEYVNLETNYVKGNELETEIATEDWRIFLKDSDGVYLILSDYLPYKYETSEVAGSGTGLGTGLVNAGEKYPDNWKSKISREDLIDRLNNVAAWNKLLDSKYIEKGITVKGALDLEKWVKSWNKNCTTQLHTKYTKDTKTYKAEGWLVGTENPPITYYCSLSDSIDYRNSLYFPHQSFAAESYGYWLVSPSANGANNMMSVDYTGTITYFDCDFFAYGVRPVVFIPSGIQAEKVGDIWKLDI